MRIPEANEAKETSQEISISMREMDAMKNNYKARETEMSSGHTEKGKNEHRNLLASSCASPANARALSVITHLFNELHKLVCLRVPLYILVFLLCWGVFSHLVLCHHHRTCDSALLPSPPLLQHLRWRHSVNVISSGFTTPHSHFHQFIKLCSSAVRLQSREFAPRGGSVAQCRP